MSPLRTLPLAGLAAVALTLAACGKVPGHNMGAAMDALACWGCHSPSYLATTAPNHVASGLPRTCQDCHSTTSWKPASTGDHDRFWPLTGKHLTTTCASCHVNEVYAGTPRECVGCHRGEYDQTTAPAHAAAGFPTTCDTCHGVTAWTPATFDHQAVWPLRGQHLTAACVACHAGGVYEGTPRLCDGCHALDYNSSANPSHPSLSLPRTCETCHDESAWTTNRFPGHDTLFPITNGKHRGYACRDCHKSSASDWGIFTCTGCHEGEHQLAKMNAEHDEEPNYQQTLSTYGTEGGCLHCHPQGRKEDD